MSWGRLCIKIEWKSFATLRALNVHIMHGYLLLIPIGFVVKNYYTYYYIQYV